MTCAGLIKVLKKKVIFDPLSGEAGRSGDRVCIALWIDLQEEVLQGRPSNETILDTKLLIRKLHLAHRMHVFSFYSFDKCRKNKKYSCSSACVVNAQYITCEKNLCLFDDIK